MENIASLIKNVYDVCSLDINSLQKDSQVVVAWPPLSSMSNFTVEWDQPQTKPNTMYIHIPFCTGICTFCNYVTKSIDQNNQEITNYLNLLEQEAILLASNLNTKKINVSSLYIGGGTPSMLNEKNLTQLLEIIDQYVCIVPGGEFTLEGCPETLTLKKLKILKNAGVNRISIGVESFDDNILKLANRRHNKKQTIFCIENIHAAGYKDFSIDLINNLPGSNHQTAITDSQYAINTNVPSLTLYHYHVKPKSINFKKTSCSEYLSIKQNQIVFHQIYKDQLLNNYTEYLVDCYSKNNLKFRHQLLKWNENANQLTLGQGCYGYYENTQFRIHTKFSAYQTCIKNNQLPIAHSHQLSTSELEMRKFLLNLRKTRKIPAKLTKNINHKLLKLIDLNLLEQKSDNFLITNIGTLFFDEIQRLIGHANNNFNKITG